MNQKLKITMIAKSIQTNILFKL